MNRPSWVPWTTYTGVSVVGVTTIGMSGIWLTQLAELVGIDYPLAISLPVAVDAGGAVATVLWVTHAGAVEKWARGVAIGALAFSLTGNALSHLIRLAMLPVSWPLVVAVSAVYPLMCWLMVHLLVLARTGARKPATRPKVSVPAVKKAEPTAPIEPAKPDLTPLRVVPQQPATKKEAGRLAFFNLVDQGRAPRDIRPAEIDKLIGASGYSKQLIGQWRDEAIAQTAATN